MLLPQHLHEVCQKFWEKTFFNPLSANPTKWSNTLKQFVDNLPTNCLSVFDHFVKLTLKRLRQIFKVDSKLCDLLRFGMWIPSKMAAVWIILKFSILLCLPLVNWKSIIHLIFLICIIYALLTTALLLTITLLILTWLLA